MSDIDYDLADGIIADTPERRKALADPLRLLLADLVLERAMTVSELADEVGRPRGTVAYHVDVLVGAGLLQVVRTRRVRAIDERFYGRTARTFVYEEIDDGLPFIREALAQCADPDPELPRGSTLRHARIPAERVGDYIHRLHELAIEFSREPRSGGTEYALMFHVFPTNRFQAAAPGSKPSTGSGDSSASIEHDRAPRGEERGQT